MMQSINFAARQGNATETIRHYYCFMNESRVVQSINFAANHGNATL